MDQQQNAYVAMKIVKSAKHYTETAEDEVKLLQQLATSNPSEPGFPYVVRLMDHFYHQGPHGMHVCMVFEVLGENLLTLIRRFDHRGLPMDVVRRFTKQLLLGLDYMHRVCGIIHTDIKPENVLLCVDERKFFKKFGLHLLESQQQQQPADNYSDQAETTERMMTRSHRQRMSEQKLPQSQSLERNMSSITLASTTVSPRKRTNSINHVHDVELPPSKRANSPSKPPTVTTLTFTSGSTTTTSTTPGQSLVTPPLSPIERYLQASVKIADLGNACWTHHHFTSDIQTRQYRSPEAILGAPYDTSADLWSVACLVFELLTGDYLFEPKSGEKFGKDDDHLAQIMELLGPIPRSFIQRGKFSGDFFNRKGELRHISTLRFWALKDVLMEKYMYKREDAESIASFMLPMLTIVPDHRASAADMLKHPWLQQ